MADRRTRIACTRRRWLQAAGVTAMAAPLIPSLEAFGQSRAIAPKLLVFYQPHGTVAQGWYPEQRDIARPFGIATAPLEAMRDRLLFIGGLRATATGGAGHDHVQAGNGLTTGRATQSGGAEGHPSGESFDQRIARGVGAATRYPSLALGVGSSGTFSCVSAGPGSPVQPENDPTRVFDRLFGSGIDTGAAERERERARRGSVLDFVQSNLEGVSRGLGAADRQRLDAHLTSVREIANALDGADSTGACVVPAAPSAGDPTGRDAFPRVGPVQQQLAMAALACEQTRVVTIQWGDHGGGVTFDWLGISDDYHFTAHRGNVPPLENAVEYLPAARWFAERFRALLELMQAIDLGDGSLLDHTVVAWLSPVGHGVAEVPVLLAGGERTGLRTGRFLQVEGGHTNDLMVSLSHLMGVEEVTTFGDPAHSTGPLAGLT
jgi:hypothetical protein